MRNVTARHQALPQTHNVRLSLSLQQLDNVQRKEQLIGSGFRVMLWGRNSLHVPGAESNTANNF